MKFAQRILNIQPSMTLAISAKAQSLKEQGIDVIGFGAGEPDFSTPENIKQAAIDAIQNNETHYTIVSGTNALKDAIIEKFEHDNGLAYDRKQIVVSCDRPPKALVALEDRLRSRFGWGLIADVQPPDFETRIAILQAKAEGCSSLVPDEVLAYIARKIPSNIRELEGALNRVVARANLIHAPLTLEAAERALDSILSHMVDLSPERIVKEVAYHFGLSEKELLGRSRARAVSVPRQLAMFLIRQETDASLPQIGQILGGRDHTTVMHGCDKISSQIETDERLRRDWLAIKQRLSEGNGAH